MIEIVRLSGSLKRVCPLIALIDEGAEQFKAKKYLYRMWDLSQFMKVLKQRFTQWFNKRHGRRGTLWEDRFKSVLVEDGYTARVMSAYIDLNPLRAGIVNDPARYRWSSYGAAVAGDRLARGGGSGAHRRLASLLLVVVAIAPGAGAVLAVEGEGAEALRMATEAVGPRRNRGVFVMCSPWFVVFAGFFTWKDSPGMAVTVEVRC